MTHSPSDAGGGPGAITERLSRCYSGIIFDVLRERGLTDCVLPRTIRALRTGQKVAGPAFTMSGRAMEGLSVDETMIGWTEFLSAAPADHVVLCQPNDDELAHMGELSAEALAARGVRGFIVDGGCRDTAIIEELGFPVFCRYRSPQDVVGRWIPETLGKQILIGSVEIASGDFVLADSDGIVCIPAALVRDVLDRAEILMGTENRVRKAILEGIDPKEAYLRYRKF